MSSHIENSSSLVASDSRNIEIGELVLDIISVGGYYTCIQLPKHKIIFDMGICPKNTFRSNHVFFTHPHPDHMGAVIQHISTREMLSSGKSSYLMEDIYVSHFENILESWRKMSRCQLDCEVIGLRPDDVFTISRDHLVVPFRSVHRIPCMGYTLYKTKKKLHPDFHGKSANEIIAAKKQGLDIHIHEKKPLLSITGDTTHHVFANNPIIFDSEVLITEVTFFGDDISPDRAVQQGHMHIDDLLRYEDQLVDTHVVIMHLSSRYSIKDVEAIIQKKFRPDLLQNITIVSNSMII